MTDTTMDIFTPEGLTILIKTVGYFGLFGIIFTESGLFLGFFLPGDSLIFTAGFLASQGFLNIWVLIAFLFVGAVLGDNFGYSFGRKVGPRIFKREDSILFHKENLIRANAFYLKHGPKALILARFIPVVRTFAPILAGVGTMAYRRFFFYNLIGGAIWTISLPLIGYYLGKTIPSIDKYLLPIILGIIILSFMPTVIHLIKTGELKMIIKKLIKILKK